MHRVSINRLFCLLLQFFDSIRRFIVEWVDAIKAVVKSSAAAAELLLTNAETERHPDHTRCTYYIAVMCGPIEWSDARCWLCCLLGELLSSKWSPRRPYGDHPQRRGLGRVYRQPTPMEQWRRLSNACHYGRPRNEKRRRTDEPRTARPPASIWTTRY